jgi:lathosterol oxidase
MRPVIENIGYQFGPGLAWLLTSVFIFLRYAIPASLVFLLIYKWKRKAWFARKIQQKFPETAQLRHEIAYSALTSFIFGGMAIGIFILRKLGCGELYFEIEEYGWGYYIFTVFFMIVAHDTYFYWVHRLMHHPKLFRYFHLVHHQSTNPTPYTSFSFHPLESVLEFAIIPILTLVIPVHASAFFLFTLWSIFFNVLGHTGYEISPSGFTRHRFFKWLNTPTHHNMHHRYSHYNYSLYFNFWDRVMGTNHPEYDRQFEEVVGRIKRSAKTGIAACLLLISTGSFAQMSLKDIQNGNYGSPEYRTHQIDSAMQAGLVLRKDQITQVHTINLHYSKRVEEEVVKPKLSDWSKYRKLMKIQKEKDKELQSVLSSSQFEKYKNKRDAMFWEGVKAYFY